MLTFCSIIESLRSVAMTFLIQSVFSSFITLVVQFTAWNLSLLRGISLSVKYSVGLLVTLCCLPKPTLCRLLRCCLPKPMLCRLLRCVMSLSTTLDICTHILIVLSGEMGVVVPVKFQPITIHHSRDHGSFQLR
jgi:hypothetical protein